MSENKCASTRLNPNGVEYQYLPTRLARLMPGPDGRPKVLVCVDGLRIENLCSAVSTTGDLCTHPDQHKGPCWRGPTAVQARQMRPGEWVLY